MPLPGGASAKAGVRYEYLWTVMCMTRVLRGEADWIYLEPPGEEGEGVEFSLSAASGTEYHQVKRQLTGKGAWSLRELSSRGVLGHFYNKLNALSATCVFVSGHSAHILDELATRARDAGSWEDFQKNFISSNEWAGHFNQLNSIWPASDREDTYQRLKRIFVRREDEKSLREWVESRLEFLIAGNPANALSALLDFASNSVHKKLGASDIWEFLNSRGFVRQTLSDDSDVADIVSELNQTYIAGIQPVGIGGEIIPRYEVAQILSVFDSDGTKNAVLVSGRAGVGKTSTISQTVSEVSERGWPMLAIRVDRLEPSSTPTELGKSLGLPASPIVVLESMAKGEECLLALDQLDAVSQTSGRNPEFFDCIGATLRQAQRFPNMKILLACRKFDIENDHRFRELVGDKGIAKEVPVEPFDQETVKSVVAGMGMDASKLTPKQAELLTLPIHLRLLAETREVSGIDSSGFQTAKDLYDRFWEYKRSVISVRLDGRAVQNVVNRVVSLMTQRQALSIPVSALDEYHEEVSVLASENILVRDGQRIAFFHESFYDYLFARKFVSDDLDLAPYIIEQEQGLFIRSQVRQVLLHQRDISIQDFCRSMDSILGSEDIRTHLKVSVVSLLSLIENPTAEDWDILEPLLESDISGYLWGAIRGSVAWFDLLDELGEPRRWLESGDEQLTQRALWHLWGIQKERMDRVVELLYPYLGVSESWNRHLAEFFLRMDVVGERKFIDFALRLVESGALDQYLHPASQDHFVWYPIRDVSEDDSDWVCELVKAYLERSLILAEQYGLENPFSTRSNSSQTASEVVRKISEASPVRFVETLLPFLSNVVKLNARKTYGPPWRDTIWGHGIIGLKDGLDSNFLLAMESAMGYIARNEPDRFNSLSEDLRRSEYRTIQNLLIQSFAAGGDVYADVAVEYLLEYPKARFKIDFVSTNSEYTIMNLLRSVTPYCSQENLDSLEMAILDHYPEYEREAESRERRGYEQWALLESVDLSRLSVKATRRLQELRRKFEEKELPTPSMVEVGSVVPPIPKESSRKMTDDQWLRAIRRYSSDSLSNDPETFLKGGARELSRLLETQTKEDPGRFARLAHRMPDDANPSYFEAILRGITESELDMKEVVRVCLRCHEIPGHPLGSWITRPLENAGDFLLPDEALDMIAWYATRSTDPNSNEVSSTRTFYQGSKKDSSYDPISVEINTARGTASGTIAKLIFQGERYLSFFKPYFQKMVNDPSDAVRACVAEALVGTLKYDRDLAVRLFVQLCDTDERLLATHHIEIFLKYATQTHFRQVEPILLRMLESEHDDVATAGARWACYASLSVEEAVPLAEQVTSGSPAQRLGAAEVYSVNLKASSLRSICEETLIKLFSDPDADVRREATRCFYELEGRELRDSEDFVRAYIRSPAFDAGHNPLFDALEKCAVNIPDVTLMACERVFELASEDIGDISSAKGMYSSSIVKLTLRVYSRNADSSIRSRCLDLIDKMTLAGAHGLDVISEEFDR